MSGKLENHCTDLSQHSGMLSRSTSLNGTGRFFSGKIAAYPVSSGYLNGMGNDRVKEGVCNGGIELLVKPLLVRSPGCHSWV